MVTKSSERTALDLLRYVEGAGQLGHVVTVLAELAEVMDGDRLVEAVKLEPGLATAQRLGHLLALVGAESLVAPLAAWIATERPRYVALRTDRSGRRARRDERFRVIVNERLEAER